MDLRACLPPGLVDQAAAVLNYQPFILSDEVQTGVAYSWVAPGDPRVNPPLVFRRRDHDAETWAKISEVNARLRAMYDDLLDEVARRFPKGSLLDVACNNGYFPVGAELRGMHGTGMDTYDDYRPSVAFLNDRLGTNATFLHRMYDPRTHTLPIEDSYDVTVMSAVMCHIPDPLHFLGAVAAVTKKAFLFWGQIVDTDALLVSYNPPHPALSNLKDFPNGFNDNTRLSRGLFELSLRLLGFREIVEIPPRDTWLAGLHHRSGHPLERELHVGSPHVALLALR